MELLCYLLIWITLVMFICVWNYKNKETERKMLNKLRGKYGRKKR